MVLFYGSWVEVDFFDSKDTTIVDYVGIKIIELKTTTQAPITLIQPIDTLTKNSEFLLYKGLLLLV